MSDTAAAVPFLRAAGDSPLAPALPDGWDTHPAGSVAGDLMEVAFDPMRYDVAFVWDRRLDRGVAGQIVREGWQPFACTDDAQIWTRDRLAMASRHLRASAAPRHALEVGL